MNSHILVMNMYFYEPTNFSHEHVFFVMVHSKNYNDKHANFSDEFACFNDEYIYIFYELIYIFQSLIFFYWLSSLNYNNK